MALVETWPGVAPTATSGRRLVGTLAGWLTARWAALVAGAGVLVCVGYVQGVNVAGWPTLANDDEGTYMARAWAIQTGRGAHHSLANYTYWYDHAPFGWMQLVPFTWMTGAFHAHGVADVTGREIMVGYALVSTVLVYVIAHRLGLSRLTSVAAMAVFGLSPVSVDYLHQIFLDCIGMPWILGAFALALSPRRSLWAFAGSGALLALSVLSKETYLLWTPALLALVWQRAERETRSMCLVAFCSVAIGLFVLYPLYAVLKGELLPGKGHVSLIGAIRWQLASRSGSGTILSTHSGIWHRMTGWFRDDPWLVAGGAAATVPALLVRRFRPIVVGQLAAAAYLVHGGYVPAMFVIDALPFNALLAVGVVEEAFRLDPVGRLAALARRLRLSARDRQRSCHRARPGRARRLAWRVGLTAGLGVLAAQMVPAWASADHNAMTYKVNTGLYAAERWVEHHAPRTARLLVDENVWIDLVDAGHARRDVVAFWELSADPDIVNRFRGGWRDMNYVVVSNTIRVNVVSGSTDLHSVAQAIAHSSAVARFGSGANRVVVRRVRPQAPMTPPRWLKGFAGIPGTPDVHALD